MPRHTKLPKQHDGQFARHEWAILGTACGHIQNLAQKLAHSLAPAFAAGYVDADHAAADSPDNPLIFNAEYTDKIRFHRLDRRAENWSAWQFRTAFNDVDVALVNGNHFAASRQLLVLDPKKHESLSRKLDRLTRVEALLWPGENRSPGSKLPADALPNFLKNHLPDWEKLPVFALADAAGIADFLKNQIAPPPLCGLVLAGGRSQRMGRDKTVFDWHGKPQREHLADVLQSLGIPAHFSCRAEQVAEFTENQRVIADTFLELGPFGAILSAFRERPDAAWLVVASDLPLLDAATLRFLVENRRPTAIATAFKSPTESHPPMPEPLITIWEPKAYLHLLQFLAQSVSCPRKVLINSDTHLLDAPDPAALTNVNTPEEALAVGSLK
ncbi:MAG: NTP transferase domain-containing protein [Saprospiraceae bacterium]